MNLDLNVSNWTQPGTQAPEVITTDFLRKLCEQMDNQAFYAAWVGFALALITIVYYGRLREKIEPKSAAFFDKLLVVGMAMCFVIIIVRLLRAG